MILSCPQCAAQYRVRNESIPVEGASLQCPQCKLEIQAFPPERDAAEILTVIKQLDAARAKLDAEYFELMGSTALPEDNASVFQSWSHTAESTINDSLAALKQCMHDLSSAEDSPESRAELATSLEHISSRLIKLQESNPGSKQ